jgi:outer membrane receptor protein involved in Fe transport
MIFQSNSFFYFLRYIGAAVLGGFALSLANVAQAQADLEDVVEEIIVTGSHIARSEFSNPIPIAVMDSEDIEIGAIETLDALLQQHPSVQQVTTARESTSGTDRSGVASVALRGLGVERTLTLLDGKRMVSSRTGRSNVDLSTIPVDFIERIEIITGGASAIYGSDALAGVINIITKSDFEGVTLRARTETPEAGGEENFTLGVTMGSAFADGKGHAMMNASFFDRRALRSADRHWAVEALEVRSDGTVGPDFSSFTVGGRYDLLEADGTRIGGTGATGGRVVLTPGTTAVRPFVEDIHGYNTNELASITTPIRRYNFATKADYQLNERVNLFMNGYYSRTDTISNRGPENTQAREYHLGSDFNTWMIPIDNPLIPQSILDIAFNDFSDGAGGTDVIGLDWRRRFTEIDRFIENTRETFRFGIGLEGDLNDNWDWNVGLNYGRTQQSQLVSGNTIKANVVDALDIEPDPTNPGEFRCVNPQSVARGCVPLNIFGEGSVTPEMVAWIKDDSTFLGSIEQMTLSALVTGDLMELPAGTLGVAAGLEYREDDSRTITDSLLRDQGTTFVAVPSNGGATDVREIFVEAVVPLLADRPFANYLGVEAAVRYADYSHVGGVTSYKGGFEWAPIESLRFRGGWSRATRAPSIIEAFSVPRTTTFGKDDPCDGITAADAGTVVGDNCLSIAAIAAEVTATGTFDGNLEIEERGFNLGNPNLAEEQADTVTIGAVFEPEFLPGFGLTVDYWDIDIEDAIVGTSRQNSLDLCYESVGFSNTKECALVFRDGNTGSTRSHVTNPGLKPVVSTFIQTTSGSWARAR